MSSSVAVVILNWNGKEDTLNCLQSLEYQKGVEITTIVVDNGSTDDSASVFRGRYPTAVIIETGANLGYAAGNNVGLAHALKQGFEYILVLNNDTILDSDCIAQLVAELQTTQNAAAVSPKMFYLDPPDMVYFAGGIVRSDGYTNHIGVDEPDDPEFREPCDTAWLTGCAIMFRSSALDEIGLFEPRFFLLYEDVDWSMRAIAKEHTLRIVPTAVLWHKVSASFGTTWSPFYLYYYTRNTYLWIERNFPPHQWPKLYYRATRRASYFAQRSTASATLELNEHDKWQKAVRQGMLDYLLRRFGHRAYKWQE